MSFIDKIFGDANEKEVKKFQPIVQKINELEDEFSSLSDQQLKEKTEEFKKEIKDGKTLDDMLPKAFALTREASKRTLKQRHYDVQLIGGMAIHKGIVAEMKTGEGKTLVSTLPTYLNALEQKGVHVITVNDYLTKRDAVWMGQIYTALGLTVGCVAHDSAFIYDTTYTEKDEERDEQGGFKVYEEFLRPVSRKEAYQADITYGTNNEFGFDYLRDNMAYDLKSRVQRGHNFVIIDEVDSVLIDESRTPLIISAPDEKSSDWYKDFARLIPRLDIESDYEVDEKLKAVTLTEAGIDHVEKLLGVEDIYQEKGIKYIHHLENALKAQVIFKKDRNYVVKDGQIIIVDEFTGRLLPGRRYSGGLHQALEAKENVQVQAESLTLASVTFQNYFRLYKKLSGMTGTAITSAEEFHKVYNLEVLQIPTNKPLARKDLPDRVYKTGEAKLKAVVKEIKERHAKGQPVLCGTTSIEKNEYLHQLLEREGVKHEVLNAKNHEREGEIIAQAGKKGAVTIATNMAGRGVDIVLGGNPIENEKEVKESGGLHVIGTERHEARRIDNQLRGRSGRQGDPGSSQIYISLEDDLMRIFGGDRISNIMTKFNLPDDQPIEAGIVSNALESAQSKIEGMNFDARKHLLDYDDVLNKHREIFYKKRREILEMEENNTLSEYILSIAIQKGFKKEDYEAKKKEIGEENMKQAEKAVALKVMDSLWIDHLETMDALRDSVRLRAYGQQDPLVEYKNEGRKQFQELVSSIDALIAKSIFTAKLNPHQHQEQPVVVKKKTEEKIGRNDLCHCGSGKKYKKCHGK